jgi:NTE family protein
MTTAFVLSGGGSLGAVQVGMLRALHDDGVTADLLVGTSAGALNAAYLATRGTSTRTLDELAAIWAGLRRRDVFPVEPLRHLNALRGGEQALFTDRGLRRLLDTHLTGHTFATAEIPVHVVATNLLTGEEVLLSDGDLDSAVLASAAIPAVLPAVERDGLLLVDGGLADHAAISQAVALGADRVFVLPGGYACALPGAPRSALASGLHALSLLIQQRLARDVRDFAGRVELHVLPPLCPLRVSPADFRHGAALIDRAENATAGWLRSGGPSRPRQDRFLSMHGHPPPAPTAPTMPRLAQESP